MRKKKTLRDDWGRVSSACSTGERFPITEEGKVVKNFFKETLKTLKVFRETYTCSSNQVFRNCKYFYLLLMCFFLFSNNL